MLYCNLNCTSRTIDSHTIVSRIAHPSLFHYTICIITHFSFFRHTCKLLNLSPRPKPSALPLCTSKFFYNLANLIKLDPERSSEALKLYNRALSMKVDMVEAYINKGDLLLKLDRVEEAKQSFLNAVKYNPNYADAHFNLGSVYLRLEDMSNAEKHYKKALAIDPRYHLSLFNLGMLYVNKHDKDRDKKNIHRAKEL